MQHLLYSPLWPLFLSRVARTWAPGRPQRKGRKAHLIAMAVHRQVVYDLNSHEAPHGGMGEARTAGLVSDGTRS